MDKISMFCAQVLLKDIDIYLPKIQCLLILSPMTTVKEVTQMVDILSRLSRLEKFFLWFRSKTNCQSIREKIMEKCPRMKSLVLF